MWPKLNMMKHFYAFAALLLSLTSLAQMPYNPDSNGDQLIGATDLISLLGLYNTLMIDSSMSCDYEGTDLEELIGGLLSQNLSLDSVYVEYSISVDVQEFVPGCPEPVVVETVLERSFMLREVDQGVGTAYYVAQASGEFLGYPREFEIRLNIATGGYQMTLKDNEVSYLTNYLNYSQWWVNNTGSFVQLPFPESWGLTEDGIQVDWYGGHWAHNCQEFRLLPFWSETD